jgi:hypothetical protein
MNRIIKSLVRSKLQEWPYDELKQATDDEMIEWYRKVGWIGTETRYQNILAVEKNHTYSRIGTGIMSVIFGYIIGWLLIILLVVFVAYRIAHLSGGGV